MLMVWQEGVHTALSSRSSSQTVSKGSITYTGRVDEGLDSSCGVQTTVLSELAGISGMSTELKLSRILHGSHDGGSTSGREQHGAL